jgi:hypothetical protein
MNNLVHSLGALEDILPLTIPILIFMIPIIAILVKHQQRMAEIMRQDDGNTEMELQKMRHELNELKALVHRQAIELDDLGRLRQLTPPTAPTDVQTRIEG